MKPAQNRARNNSVNKSRKHKLLRNSKRIKRIRMKKQVDGPEYRSEGERNNHGNGEKVQWIFVQ